MCLNAVHGALHVASLAGRNSVSKSTPADDNAYGAFAGRRVLVAGRDDTCLPAARAFEAAGATVAVVSDYGTDASRRQGEAGGRDCIAEVAAAAESLGGVDVLLLGDRGGPRAEGAPDVAAAVRQHVMRTCEIIKAVQGHLQEAEGCIIDCAGPASMRLGSTAGPCPSRVADEVQAVVAQGLGDWLAPRGIRISFVGRANWGPATGYPPQALTRQIMFLASEGAGARSGARLPPARVKAGYLGCGSGVQSHASGVRSAAALTAAGGKF